MHFYQQRRGLIRKSDDAIFFWAIYNVVRATNTVHLATTIAPEHIEQLDAMVGSVEHACRQNDGLVLFSRLFDHYRQEALGCSLRSVNWPPPVALPLDSGDDDDDGAWVHFLAD